MGTIGAFIMRREFGGIFYHNYNREPPQGSRGLRPERSLALFPKNSTQTRYLNKLKLTYFLGSYSCLKDTVVALGEGNTKLTKHYTLPKLTTIPRSHPRLPTTGTLHLARTVPGNHDLGVWL